MHVLEVSKKDDLSVDKYVLCREVKDLVLNDWIETDYLSSSIW